MRATQAIGVDEMPSSETRSRAGRYELLLQIAQGGMGAVWIARLRLDNGFEKFFAVKTLLAQHAEQPMFREMFLDEARLAASITHPNVAQIIDMGEGPEQLYLVMEWVEGASLNDLARIASRSGQLLPHGIVLRVLADACAGLHAIHEHSSRGGAPLDIVHRDISPNNILLATCGATKIIDLGIAMARGRMSETTSPGFVKGKLRFMSPEQAAGKPVDRRADIWGIGAVLHAVISGRPPYHATLDLDVVRGLMSGESPPPLADAPAPIQAVLSRALAWDPNQRYATAAELGEALERAARELGVTASERDVATYVTSAAGARIAELRDGIELALEADDDTRPMLVPQSELQQPVTPQSEVQPITSGTFRKSATDTFVAPEAPARCTDTPVVSVDQAVAVVPVDAAAAFGSDRAFAPTARLLWGLAALASLVVVAMCLSVMLDTTRGAAPIPGATASSPIVLNDPPTEPAANVATAHTIDAPPVVAVMPATEPSRIVSPPPATERRRVVAPKPTPQQPKAQPTSQPTPHVRRRVIVPSDARAIIDSRE